MSTKGIGSAVGALVLTGSMNVAVVAQEESEESLLTANIGVTSNYMWRGATQTQNDAAVQGGIDYGMGSGLTGFYVGTWLSNVNFGDSVDDDGNIVSGAEYELDGYIGWNGEFSDNVGLDLGYVYYHYGQIESGADFGEIYGNLGLWWFDFGVYYTANSQVDDPFDTAAFVTGDIAYYGAFTIDLAQSWSLGLTIGQYDFTNDGNVVDSATGEEAELSYTYGQIDLTKSAGRFGDFTMSVSQAGEEANAGNDKPRVFVTWTKGWWAKK